MPPQSPTERVIQVVAVYSDTPPLELPALGDAIDPDALNACVESMAEGKIDFRYAGYAVTVQSDGTVDVSTQSIDGVG